MSRVTDLSREKSQVCSLPHFILYDKQFMTWEKQETTQVTELRHVNGKRKCLKKVHKTGWSYKKCKFRNRGKDQSVRSSTYIGSNQNNVKPKKKK